MCCIRKLLPNILYFPIYILLKQYNVLISFYLKIYLNLLTSLKLVILNFG